MWGYCALTEVFVYTILLLNPVLNRCWAPRNFPAVSQVLAFTLGLGQSSWAWARLTHLPDALTNLEKSGVCSFGEKSLESLSISFFNLNYVIYFRMFSLQTWQEGESHCNLVISIFIVSWQNLKFDRLLTDMCFNNKLVRIIYFFIIYLYYFLY